MRKNCRNWMGFLCSRKAALAAAFGAVTLGSASQAFAQAGHGVSIFKQCDGPKCIGESTDCEISVGHADIFGDTTMINEAFDIVNPGASQRRVPAAGNLPIVNVLGNSTCTVGGSLPCLIGPSGSTLSGLPGAPSPGLVTFQSETVILVTDPRPLPDQANVRVQDVCDSPSTINCSPTLISTVQFVAETPINLCADALECTVDCCLEGVCSHPSTCVGAVSCRGDDGIVRNFDPLDCDDANACTTDVCDDTNEPTCCTFTPVECPAPPPCFTQGPCDAIGGCPDPVSVCADPTFSCDDGDPDTTDSCDDTAAATGCCVHERVQLEGCRITGGRTVLDGEIIADPDGVEILRGQGGGQVGAPCGCIGCFDTFDHIQGQWQYGRKKKQGVFHARDFNSLICGCDQDGSCNGDGVAGSGFANPQNFQGELCNPGDPVPGPEPRPSPANLACFSGIGLWTPTNGRRTEPVAFRVEVEDRGEPAVGTHSDDTCDVYQIRIWIPRGQEDVEQLANDVCCINATDTIDGSVRAPDIQDGGNLVHGNIQIHPQTPNSRDGTCPVPDGVCQE